MTVEGASIAALRHALGFTQGELGELLGVHAVTVGKWERGVARPTHYQWEALELLAGAPELAAPGLRSEGPPALRLARGLTACAPAGLRGQLALARSEGCVGRPRRAARAAS